MCSICYLPAECSNCFSFKPARLANSWIEFSICLTLYSGYGFCKLTIDYVSIRNTALKLLINTELTYISNSKAWDTKQIQPWVAGCAQHLTHCRISETDIHFQCVGMKRYLVQLMRQLLLQLQYFVTLLTITLIHIGFWIVCMDFASLSVRFVNIRHQHRAWAFLLA